MAKEERPAGGAPADVFVVFGITGDLAKVMTFRSLYRLERRGLLTTPIVGVAVDDWTVDDLKQRARESIVGTGELLDEEVFGRLAARFSYVAGDFGDEDTYERVALEIKGFGTPVFYLEIPPFLFGRVVKGLSDAGLTESARVVVEKPFGHDGESARALELTWRGPEAPEFQQIRAFTGELLHAVVPAVFANVEILVAVVRDAHRIDELARAGAALAEGF